MSDQLYVISWVVFVLIIVLFGLVMAMIGHRSVKDVSDNLTTALRDARQDTRMLDAMEKMYIESAKQTQTLIGFARDVLTAAGRMTDALPLVDKPLDEAAGLLDSITDGKPNTPPAVETGATVAAPR